MDSIREQVLTKFKEYLENIVTSNDYNTNMGNNVNRNVRGALELSSLPAIIITEGSEDITVTPIGKNTCYLNLTVSGYTRSEIAGQESSEANRMIADIVKRVGVDTTLGGLAIDIIPGVRSVSDPEPETDILSVNVDFTVHYRTGHLDPYN